MTEPLTELITAPQELIPAEPVLGQLTPAEDRREVWRDVRGIIENKNGNLPSVALREAGLDFTINAEPIYRHRLVLGGDVMDTFEEIPGKRILFRDPILQDRETRYFETVSKSYGFLQNAEIAAELDSLAAKWPLDSLGYLDNGRAVFFILRVGSTEVAKGEALTRYLMVSDFRDGKRGLNFSTLDNRVWCSNAILRSIRDSKAVGTIRHNADIKAQFQFAISLATQMQENSDDAFSKYRSMAKKSISAAEAYSIFKIAYPAKETARGEELVQIAKEDGLIAAVSQKSLSQASYLRQRAEDWRSTTRQAYERFNDEFPVVARTAWAAYNSVVEVMDHYASNRGEDSRSRSSLFGERQGCKVRAFGAAVKLLKEK